MKKILLVSLFAIIGLGVSLSVGAHQIFASGLNLPYVTSNGSNLYISPTDIPSTATTETWGGNGQTTGATSTTDGFANTTAIINTLGDDGVNAASICYDLTFDGYSDWYLPAGDQISAIHTQWNNETLNKGDYADAGWVDFETNNAYLSSTESTANTVYAESFSTGPVGYGKGSGYPGYVRCVRNDPVVSITDAGVTGFTAPVASATPQTYSDLTAGAPSQYTVTNLTWSPDHGTFYGSTTYTATITLTSATGYEFPSGDIASPTTNVGTVNSVGTTSGSGSGNTLSFTVEFPETASLNLYWYHTGTATDSNWTTRVGNWWLDESHSQQAPSLPTINDDVVNLGATGTGPSVDLDAWTAPKSIDATNTGISFTSVMNGLGMDITGDAAFYGNSFLDNHTVYGDATFNGSSQNEGTVSEDAFFKDSSFNYGTVSGNATFYDDLTVNQGWVGKDKIREYTHNVFVHYNFCNDGSHWILKADSGVVVNIYHACHTTDPGYEYYTTFDPELPSDRFVTTYQPSIYYWNNGVANTNWTTQANWWTDSDHLHQATSLPTIYDDVVLLGNSGTGPTATLGAYSTPTTINSGTTGINFTSSSTRNPGIDITGNATFHGASYNDNTITGNATFYDTSYNNNTITGSAIFYGDSSLNSGIVTGTRTRYYNGDNQHNATQDFTGTDRPWTVVADGVVADVSGDTYDNTTTFQTRNGGSFTYKTANTIETCVQFEDINNNLNGLYTLGKDLDCSGEGSRIVVAPSQNEPFTGTFNGGGHTINVAINGYNDDNNIGIFGNASGANISNLNITGVIHGGSYYIGSLVGYGKNLDIENVNSTASISGSGEVGGLVGELDADIGTATISNSSSSGNVSDSGEDVGGLVGLLYSGTIGNINITNSHSSGFVDGTSEVGGLVGYLDNENGNTITISGSYSTSAVIGYNQNIGGLVGYIYDIGLSEAGDLTAVTITNSYHTTGNVSGPNNVGGLIGKVYDDYTATFNLTNSYATGKVNGGDNTENVGGLIGDASFGNNNDSIIANITGNYFSGDVSGGEDSIGGLIGYLNTDSNADYFTTAINISNNHTTGTVSGPEGIGGLIGENDLYAQGDSSFPLTFNFNNNYSTSSISEVDGFGSISGLVGDLEIYNRSNQLLTFNFNQNYATGTITTDSGLAGGLVGQLNSSDDSGNSLNVTFSQDYYSGTITDSSTTGYDGGLFGRLLSGDGNPIILSDSYANVDVTGYEYLGGLIGSAGNVSISNSYASGTVKGNDPESSTVGGGLIGKIEDDYVSINNSFGVNTISQLSEVPFGAVIGSTNSYTVSLSNNFYDQTLSGQTSCEGDITPDPSDCTAINTTDVPNANYFKGDVTANVPFVNNWIFPTTWRTNTNSYPTLRYFFPVLDVPPVVVVTPPVVHSSGGGGGGGGNYYVPPKTPVLTTATTTTTGVTSSLLNFKDLITSKNLSLGMTNNPLIKTLQLFLISQNAGPQAKALAKHGATNNFGSLTKLALMEFQKAHNIRSTGIMGPDTRKAIALLIK